ncbi:MAG TPA: hypothetical protein VJ757_04430, partial [Pseudonocardiaceae bacterium]|nr:hypothetical protein [Pseudonocardiaceae bacterium]
PPAEQADGEQRDTGDHQDYPEQHGRPHAARIAAPAQPSITPGPGAAENSIDRPAMVDAVSTARLLLLRPR